MNIILPKDPAFAASCVRSYEAERVRDALSAGLSVLEASRYLKMPPERIRKIAEGGK